MFWVGLVIAIVGIVATTIFAISAAESVTDSFGEAAPMTEGTATVVMGEGEQRTILGLDSQEANAAECSVVGPDGENIPVQATSEFLTAEDIPVEEVGTFTSAAAGTYVVECTGGLTSISPALDLASLGSDSLGILGGIVAIGLGGLLLVIGAVLWFVGRSRAKKAATGDSYSSGGSFEGGYGSVLPGQDGYAQGGYAQGGPGQGGYAPPPPPRDSSPPPSSNPYERGSGSPPPPPPPPPS